MSIAAWNFYTTTYHGDILTESLFDKYESKAEDTLQRLCFDRINDEVIEDLGDKLKKAVCAVADNIYKIEEAINNVNNPKLGNVKSMSSGSESVSFGSNETIYMKVVGDTAAQYRLLRDVAAVYLTSSGLLYAGG